MGDDWLDAVRASLPPSADAGFTEAPTVTLLNQDEVRPERLDNGAWRIHGAERELAALPDDDALLELLGLEWAGPVELTDDEGAERLWLYRGHWFLVTTPEGGAPQQVRAEVSDRIVGHPATHAVAQADQFDQLVDLLPPSDAQGRPG